ncbi:MAG TPA: paraquat-inducible protein A [Usitatibacter sp.]|nr:paraquat-inducible protein A [Usitatibacter sp.]
MTATAARHGLWLCEACTMLNRRVHDGEIACARCGAHLHERKTDSVVRGWAFLIAAAILYIPANVLPVMHTGTIFNQQTDTILSGVVHLWVTGSWVLAVIVFIASIVVPAAKLASLAVLLRHAQRRSTWRPQLRARIYRMTHFIGRWSMVDIFVGATLVAVVQFKAFGGILPGPGAIAFGAVVVLTMLASQSFDPRLTWDPIDDRHE